MSERDTRNRLTVDQLNALFDSLTHHATYAEIEGFKDPNAIDQYGPPFQESTAASTSPILQTLVSKFMLPLPGLRDVKPHFWKTLVRDLISDLSAAELSESYDKATLGIRKTLATAISALVEYPARASLGGVGSRSVERRKNYDTKDPDDVHEAWNDSLQFIIYGDLIDEVIDRAAETDDLLKHDSLVQGAHEYIIVK